MAKKKTENIKAAPMLRAQSGGDEPTPTPEQTGTRTYQIIDPWKDRDVVNLVDVKAVDGEITEVKVNGEPAGGGGDPETINIKIKNSSSHPIIVSAMIDSSGLTASRRVSNNSTETLRFVMYEPEMPFTFTTTDGGSINSTSAFGTTTFNNAHSGYVTQSDTITITSA